MAKILKVVKYKDINIKIYNNIKYKNIQNKRTLKNSFSQ